MSTPKHTPGPWEIQELPDNEGGSPCFRITGESTLFLDVCECADGYVPGENEANARLIAAAPDLFSACSAAAYLLQSKVLVTGAERDTLAILADAIAKAEGGAA